MSDGEVSDASPGNWIDSYAPRWFRPFARMARLDRPIGWRLLLWPCWWSVALAVASDPSSDASAYWQDIQYLMLFFVGAVVMRGAGCTWNDIVDRKIDALVERTRSRPLPSGQITVRAAGVFLTLQALIGLIVLLQFNRYTVLLGLSSLLVVAIYPFMKRITHWPQFVLGLAFSWGGMLGWTAHFGSLHPAAIAVFAASVVWTIGYDTIYAHQDTDDDELIGIKSTAMLFKDDTRNWLVVFYGATIALLALAVFLAELGVAAYIGIGIAALHLGWQILVLDIGNPDKCLSLFKANRWMGWMVFLGFVIDGQL
ncbi:MAG: 4-hydroxybenzoate octaprenyltransferase [Hyphomicrobiales bacterium]|nr:MAG: 4-hydroxybenzoate octaprenyltransferase [Hyphomicrobiales bacterium]